MEYLVVEKNKKCVVITRKLREVELAFYSKNKKKDFGVVLKTFINMDDANEYAERINFSNNIIKKL